MDLAEVQVSSSKAAEVVVAEAAALISANGKVRLTAINFAMPTLVKAVEQLKHKVSGLHQLNEVEHIDESNKVRLAVTLSYVKFASTHYGYQAPIAAEHVRSVPLAELSQIPKKLATTERNPEGVKERRHFDPRGPRRPAYTTDAGEEHKRPIHPKRAERPHGKPQDDGKYEKVPRHPEDEKLEGNEIRVTSKRPALAIVKEAVLLIKRSSYSTIVLKATGSAIPRAVEVSEALRHSVGGLHQQIVMSRREVTDIYKAKDAGVDDLEVNRTVPHLTVTLSRSALDTRHYGYQAPLPVSQVREMTIEEAQAFEPN